MRDNEPNEQIKLLREIAKWSRFMGFSQVKDILEYQLKEEKNALAYHLSDGTNTSRIIAKATGINRPKVIELWRAWMSLGLGEPVSASGGSRFKKSFDLKMFGISVPEVKQKQSEQENVAPATERISDG